MSRMWMVVLGACLLFAVEARAQKMTVDQALGVMVQAQEMRDPARREAALNAFRDLPADQTKAALEKLKPVLATVPENLRYVAAEACQRIGDAAIPMLAGALEDDAAWPAATAALQRFGAKAIVPAAPLLANSRAEVRLRAASLLDAVLPAAIRYGNAETMKSVPFPALAAALGERLEDRAPAVALAAAKALAGMGAQASPAREALAAAAAAPDPALRAAAALALGRTADPAAAPALVKMLADPDDLARLQAAQGLADLGDPAMAQLSQALNSDNALLRRTAVYALGRMSVRTPNALQALAGILTDPDELVRADALDALGSVAAPGLLNDPAPLVRTVAATLIENAPASDPAAVAAAGKTRDLIAAAAKPQSFEEAPRLYPKLDMMVGGKLEGPQLPLFVTTHGEPPGFPGCVPQLAAKGQAVENMGKTIREFTSQGQLPEYQLYPGAVEHFRAYWQKYVPARGVFDAESLIRNFAAKDLPGVDAAQVAEYAAPLYWVPRFATPADTGLKNAPVPVVRCGPKAPVFPLDLGTLPVGLYAVRVIGAVETKDLQRFRKPLYIAMTVNDGLQGEENTYTLRCGYCDEFYSIAEIYFHAPEKRAYKSRLWVAEGSQVTPLVHNITLDDALVGMTLRPVKTRMTLTTPQQRAQVRADKIAAWEKERRDRMKWTPPAPRPLEEQWARDAVLWTAFPHVNAQLGQTYGAPDGALYGTGGKPQTKWDADQADAAPKWGLWSHIGAYDFYRFTGAPNLGDLRPLLSLMSNATLGLNYTMADLAAGKPLPDPYPFKDNGAGLCFPSADPKTPPQLFDAVSNGVGARQRAYADQLNRLTDTYVNLGDIRAGREAALMLIRWAYDAPAADAANSLSSLVADPGPWGRDLRCRRRETVAVATPHPALYDKLFDVIRGNEELARSVNRFIPWVKSNADVIALCDAYICQDHARRIMRYEQMSDNAPTMIVEPAAVVGDREFTRPWLEWLWAKAYIYPNPTSGLPDMITTANDRNGAGYIGSWFYCGGEEASNNGEALASYIAAGGDPKYDLRDAKLYPKVTAGCSFQLQTWMAGLYWPRVGDVCGPDKGYAAGFGAYEEKARRGWHWTKDPVFAWMIKNHFGRKGDSDRDWDAIERAAARIERPPYMTNPSRVVSNWMGVLEAGRDQDDPRFRRAVMLRIGEGYGHQHGDTLDLQIYAHGYPFTIDDGQRSGYTSGASSSTRWHNVVQVDDKNWRGPSWVRSLSDAEGARYMLAQAVPVWPDVKSFTRQVALVDVDEGQGAAPVTPEAILTGKGLPKAVVTPDSYIVDVVRVAGKKHTYNFHGPIDDLVESNVAQKAASVQGKREGFPSSAQGFTGIAPEVLATTWRMRREPMGTALGERAMAPWFDPRSPLKYTRLYLLGQKGAEVHTDWTFCKQWKYGFTNLYATRASEQDADAVFPAVIEPYVGEPFITSVKLLPIEGNDAGVAQAVAIEVRTKTGHADTIFADGSPDKTRRSGEASFSGEFAAISFDADGLRLASVAGGSLLDTPLVTLKAARRETVGRITAVNYPDRSFTTDVPLPPFTGERPAEFRSGTRGSTFMLSGVKGITAVTRGGACYYAGRIADIDAKSNTVYCAVPIPLAGPGENDGAPPLNKGIVVSNRAGTKFWRAEYLHGDASEGRFGFKLDAPATDADFRPAMSLCAWEYGVGDTVRQNSFALIRRVSPGVYELSSDVDVTVALKAAALEVSPDGQTWKPATATTAAGKVQAAIKRSDLGPAGKVFIKAH